MSRHILLYLYIHTKLRANYVYAFIFLKCLGSSWSWLLYDHLIVVHTLKLTTGRWFCENLQKEKNMYILLLIRSQLRMWLFSYLFFSFQRPSRYNDIKLFSMITKKRRRCPIRAVLPELAGCTTSFRDHNRTSPSAGVHRVPSSTWSGSVDGRRLRFSWGAMAALGDRSSTWSCPWWCRRPARHPTMCPGCSETVSTPTGTVGEN